MSRLPLTNIIQSYQAINEQLLTITDTPKMIKLSKELKVLEPQFELAIEIQKLETELAGNKVLLEESDEELKTMAEAEIENILALLPNLEEQLLVYLTPRDERDAMNVLLEIRAGAGGDESSLFAGELMKSYSIMANKLGMNFSVVDVSLGTVGGFKEVIAEVKGVAPFSWFKYEGGVHRVQRVPETEKQGRVHTSTVSVAIMPLVEENSVFELNINEVEVIATTSQGAGGQSVNTTYSAVQMVHKPTGIKAQCQDERAFQQNKIKCWQILTSRVYDFLEGQRLEKEYNERRGQVGTADRSEKIRTYNFPQDRLTDHRYNRNWNQLPIIMNGGIQDVVEEIKRIEAAKSLTVSEQ